MNQVMTKRHFFTLAALAIALLGAARGVQSLPQLPDGFQRTPLLSLEQNRHNFTASPLLSLQPQQLNRQREPLFSLHPDRGIQTSGMPLFGLQ